MPKKLSRATLAVDDSFCSNPDFDADAFLKDTLKAVLPHLAELYDTEGILQMSPRSCTSDPKLWTSLEWFSESIIKKVSVLGRYT